MSLGDRDVEVYYPADPASTAGLDRDVYTQLEPFPEQIRTLLDDLDTEVVVDAYRDVPAASDGPFPVVVYSHGYGGYRKIATFQFVHLASWGYVVASTDHLERGLLAVNGFVTVEPDDAADERDMVGTIDLLGSTSATDGNPLAGAADMDRVVVMGHSAGGFAAANVAAADPRVDGLISWASGGDVSAPLPSVPSLFVVADGDATVDPGGSRAYLDALPGERSWVVLDAAGHNTFTDACAAIYDRGGLADVAASLGLPPEQTERAEEGCLPDLYADPRISWQVLNATSLAFLARVFGSDLVTVTEPFDIAESATSRFGDAVEAAETLPAS